MGGFGSAVLEAAADAGLDASRIHRLGVPDQFIEHGDRLELLAGLGLDARGIAGPCASGSAARAGAGPTPGASRFLRQPKGTLPFSGRRCASRPENRDPPPARSSRPDRPP